MANCAALHMVGHLTLHEGRQQMQRALEAESTMTKHSSKSRSFRKNREFHRGRMARCFSENNRAEVRDGNGQCPYASQQHARSKRTAGDCACASPSHRFINTLIDR